MTRRIVVIANRLPVSWDGAGWVTSPGGLVRALEPVLQKAEGSWVGWSGNTGDALEPFEHDGPEEPCRNDPVGIDVVQQEGDTSTGDLCDLCHVSL